MTDGPDPGAGARKGNFIGRRGEIQTITTLIDAARSGRSGALVMRAAAGLGKTYLLSRVIGEHADGIRVLAVSGAESEMVLAYASLQQLCAPLRDHIDQLPALQRHALQVATGHEAGDPPDPFLVGLAVMNLLSDAGAEKPTLCIVDDAQWVDEPSRRALGFAARRLLADPVALLFATRDTDTADHLDGLPELWLPPLSDGEARLLLEANLPGRLDQHVRARVLAEAAGNPLALTELPHALSPAELAGGFGLGSGHTLTTRLEHNFAQRCRVLPEPTRLLLLIASAEPVGDPAWLWSAAERLGLGVDDAGPAEAAGLIKLDTRIRFRHPLVRTAVYRTAPAAQRLVVHSALAETIAGPDAADYRAWHHAHATNAPQEAIAAELIASADRARQRGGVTAAAAFLQYAVDLTPDVVVRARRALDAAAAKLDAGDTDSAARLIDLADGAEGVEPHVTLMRAKLAFATNRGRDGPRLLLAAARQLSDQAPAAARDTYLEAMMAAMIVGRLGADSEGPDEVALVAKSAPPAPGRQRAVDRLLDALIVRFTDGYVPAAPLLKKALHAYLREVRSGTADPHWHDITNRICLDLFDFDSYTLLAERQLDLLRSAGELTVLPAALTTSAAVSVLGGDFPRAEALLDEAFVVSTATGAPPHRSGEPLLAAHQGRAQKWHAAERQTMEEATERGEGTEVTVAFYAGAVLHAGFGRYQEALEVVRKGLRYNDIGLYGSLLIELAEAAAYTGDYETARGAAAEIAQRAAASHTESALGLAARSHALAEGDAASAADFEQAITHLERSPLRVYLARTHLVYGEWLRRRGRRAQAGTQLRIAYDMCTQMGAEAFSERARRELEIVGGSTATRDRRYETSLTAQERSVGRFVQQGYTNGEIAEHLLISHRTVEWHLRNIFNKLGISSRRELRSLAIEPD